MSTDFCGRCQAEHPGRACNYGQGGECSQTTAEAWDAKHQTERLALLNKIYIAGGAVNLAECSHTVFDELPDQVQADLTALSWERL